jgi:hypothetical protein
MRIADIIQQWRVINRAKKKGRPQRQPFIDHRMTLVDQASSAFS